MTPPPRWWQRGAGRAAVAAAMLAAVAAVVWLGAWLDRAPPRPIAATLQPAAVAVAPRVYLLGKLSPSAAYAIDTSDGLVLIDSGVEPDAAGVLAQLAELRLDVTRLRAILLTHAHGDHVLGANHLRALTGATVYAGKGDVGPLRQGGPREAFFSTFHMPNAKVHPTAIDVELAGDEVLTFGDARLSVLATPGHTPGSVCYLLEMGQLRALFTGDVVQSLSEASSGALGTYAAYLPPLYRGHARDYLASLRKLLALPAPELVLPGHPRMDPSPQSPRLGEARWRALLTGGVEEMQRLLARYDADGEDFLDGTPRELLPGLHYLGGHGGAALYTLRSPKGLILFDAPGGGDLPEVLRERARGLNLPEMKVDAVFLTSADKEATAGLAALVKSDGSAVVVRADGVEAVRGRLPEGARVLAAEGIVAKGADAPFAPPGLRVLRLDGRGTAPAGYALRWANKNVLLSGRVPAKPAVESAEEAVRAVTGPGGDARAYLRSLARLAQEAPDVWLPAVPVHGQNANLYDRDWEKVLAQNRYYFSR